MDQIDKIMTIAEHYAMGSWHRKPVAEIEKRKEALRTAIEQALTPRVPVAWMYDFLNSDDRDEVIRNWITQDYADIEREKGFNVRPLYIRPPKREWVGLTDEELRDALRECPHDTVENLRVRWPYAKDFARAIEAKLKEKNGGGV